MCLPPPSPRREEVEDFRRERQREAARQGTSRAGSQGPYACPWALQRWAQRGRCHHTMSRTTTAPRRRDRGLVSFCSGHHLPSTLLAEEGLRLAHFIDWCAGLLQCHPVRFTHLTSVARTDCCDICEPALLDKTRPGVKPKSAATQEQPICFEVRTLVVHMYGLADRKHLGSFFPCRPDCTESSNHQHKSGLTCQQVISDCERVATAVMPINWLTEYNRMTLPTRRRTAVVVTLHCSPRWVTPLPDCQRKLTHHRRRS